MAHTSRTYSKILQILLVFLLFSKTSFGIEFERGEEKIKVLSLDDCIREALNKHPKIGIYGQQKVQREENLRAVTSDNLPRVDATFSYDRLSYVSQQKKRFLGESNDDFQAYMKVTQPVFTGGKIISEQKSARYAVDAAEQGYLAAREDIIFSVKDAYYRMLFARDIVRSKEELLEYTRSSYDTALDLNRRTKVPREETLLRLEVQVNEIEQELISAKESLDVSRKTLLNAMAIDLNTEIEIKDIKDETVIDDCGTVNVSENPGIRRISMDKKAAEEMILSARSGFFPQVNSYYRYGFEWGRLPGGDNDWSAGVAVDFNVWDWGKTMAEVREARAYREELDSYEKLLEQQLDLELEAARLKGESARKSFELARKNLEKARKSLNIFEARYKDTLVTSLDLLDAQKAFSLAQVRYALSILEMRLAKAEIEKISGRGYDIK
jgi:outer membrane protein